MIRIIIYVLIVAISTTAIGGLSYMYTNDIPVVYSAKIKLLVDQKPYSNSITQIQQSLPTFKEIGTSYIIAEKINQEQPDISVLEAKNALTANVIDKTQVLVLQARHSDAEKAVLIVSSASDALIEIISEQQMPEKLETSTRLSASQSTFIFTVLDPALTAEAESPKKLRTILISVISTLFVSSGGVLVLEHSRRYFKQ